MNFLQWSLERARIHPQLQDALITIDGDALSFLLPDGRTFSFRPEALIKTDAAAEKQEEILDRLITIGIANATSATPVSESAETLPKTENLPLIPEPEPAERYDNLEHTTSPIIHRAEYFLKSHEGGDSLAYLPITEDLAIGISTNVVDDSAGVYYSDLDAEGLEFSQVFHQAVAQIQEFTGTQGGLSLEVGEIFGAKIFQLKAPANYQLSFFADFNSMTEIAAQLQKEFNGGIPLFVPAAQTKLYIVNSDDPKLERFFQSLLNQRESADAVYPLPHILTSTGWQEWIPLPGSKLANTLGSLRNHFRELNYRAQVELLNNQAERGVHLEFQSQVSLSRERISACVWTSDVNIGTLPNSDIIVFGINKTLQPWDDPNDFMFMIRSSVAREVWPEGFTQMPNIWPTRWRFNHFPDPETWEKLKAASTRQI